MIRKLEIRGIKEFYLPETKCLGDVGNVSRDVVPNLLFYSRKFFDRILIEVGLMSSNRLGLSSRTHHLPQL